MFKPIASLTGGLFLAAALQAHAAPAPVTIRIDNFTFSPPVLVVPVGTTITWVNQDDVPHTAVADDHKSFRSKPMDTDERYAFTFTSPGEYPYFCSIHPRMTAKIVVKAS
ncbi:MAG TPA: cupredoxin family copper-binding protein [Caulobacteraceae bacterium]|jgi:plastocyanin|nr:cupredoxin family copper-binding protein [Caulobacteraceae bacterium]